MGNTNCLTSAFSKWLTVYNGLIIDKDRIFIDWFSALLVLTSIDYRQ
jgi:hypothetical protein